MQHDDATLARVSLHGLKGLIHVNGKPLNDIKTVMPGHGSFLNDDQIAGVITYIRNTWGNTGPAVQSKTVAYVSQAHPERRYSWTKKDLLEQPR